MFTAIKFLFSPSGFMSRRACGPAWTPDLVNMSMIGNLCIWLSYLLIPFLLLWFSNLWQNKRLDMRVMTRYSRRMVGLFVAFILCCGGTHANEVIVFVYPAYRLFTIWTDITGIVSIVTVLLMARVIGAAILPSPSKDSAG